MPLTQQQIEAYNRDGFLEIPSLFSPEEVAVLRKAFDRDCGERGPFVIRESKDDGIRALYGSHMRQPEFDQLVKTERFLGYAQQLVAGGSLFDGNSVCVVRTGGRLSCFGDNDDGQVGSPGPDALTPRDAVTER